MDILITTHSSVWFEGLGGQFVVVKLNHDKEISSSHASPHYQMQEIKFATSTFKIETIFKLVSLLHRGQRFANSSVGKDRHLYLGYCSLKAIAISSTST